MTFVRFFAEAKISTFPFDEILCLVGNTFRSFSEGFWNVTRAIPGEYERSFESAPRRRTLRFELQWKPAGGRFRRRRNRSFRSASIRRRHACAPGRRPWRPLFRGGAHTAVVTPKPKTDSDVCCVVVRLVRAVATRVNR